MGDVAAWILLMLAVFTGGMSAQRVIDEIREHKSERHV